MGKGKQNGTVEELCEIQVSRECRSAESQRCAIYKNRRAIYIITLNPTALYTYRNQHRHRNTTRS